MSSQPNVSHANDLLLKLKESHANKIKELESMIESLQYEIKVLKEFNERLDDL